MWKKYLKDLNVKKEEVVSMNRRTALEKKNLLNDPIKNEDGTEWQDWLTVDKGIRSRG